MTATEFNKKYTQFIPKGWSGLTVNIEQVVDFLDEYFTQQIRHNDDVEIHQIKLKFDYARVYTNLSQELNSLLEQQINILTGVTKFTPQIRD